MDIEIVEEPAERPGALVEALAGVWEASVRATHGFLSEKDVVSLRPEVRAGLVGVAALATARGAGGAPLGFAGVEDGSLEMLFVAPEARGRGVGRTLLAHAVEHLGAVRLEVNEQNPQAVGFYEHMGFAVAGRSPVDGAGRPWPLLHMELAATLEARAACASGRWMDPADEGLARDRARARNVMRRFNADPALDDEARMALLRGLFGSVGEGSLVYPGAQADYGCNVFIGRDCFFNFNCTFVDGAPIVFGDDVMVGPNVTFSTPLHPLLARERIGRACADGRRCQPERNLSISVGDGVWIAGGVTVNPGVSIGAGSVVGSGSIVTRDVPPGVIAFGNPCRVVRVLGEGDSVEGALTELGLL